MKAKLTFIFMGCLLLSLTACESLLFEESNYSDDPQVNFDYLWKELDRKYSYFELKKVDWKLIQSRYQSQIRENMSEEELFEVLAAMILELRDDHTNLIAPFNVAVYNTELKGPVNFFPRTLRDHYFEEERITPPFVHSFVHQGRIGYIRYGSFMDEISDYALDYVLERYAATDGLILDLRSNGGGSLFNVPLLLGRFVDDPLVVARSITRNGPKHTDFAPPEDFRITPSSGKRYSKKPVMVLIDRGSYSATTFFALATKAMPNLVLVGDTTGGGGGLPNGGQLPNGWTYRFSISQTLDLQGRNYAEQGVPPDINANLNLNDLTKDLIVDRAILEIQTRITRSSISDH
jgi:C-terminal processing protease CtpA/Prc